MIVREGILCARLHQRLLLFLAEHVSRALDWVGRIRLRRERLATWVPKNTVLRLLVWLLVSACENVILHWLILPKDIEIVGIGGSS